MGENEEFKVLKCSQCGGELTKSYRSEYDDDEEEYIEIPIAKCMSCGTEYDQTTEEYYAVFADDYTYDKDGSVFKLGMKGTIEGVEYEVIGRIRYQDEEEYEKATWDEWFTVSSDGVFHYFVEEEGKVHSYKEYIPESIDMESDPSSIDFEGKRISKNTGYVGRIVLAEGELPWKPDIGEPIIMYDFKKDGFHYSIEQSEDDISITQGERIHYDKIIEAFGSDEYKELYEKTMKGRKEYRRKSLVYLVAFAILFGLTIYSCASGRKVEGVMNTKQILRNNQYRVEGTEKAYYSQVLYGPFEMPKGGKLYNAKVWVDSSIQRFNLEWQSFRLMLIEKDRLNKFMQTKSLGALLSDIDEEKDPVESYSFSGDFWDEEGYDSDGYWHESDTSHGDNFVLDKKGKYYAFLELWSSKWRNPGAVKISFATTGSNRYYIILMVVVVILWQLNRSRAKTFNELPFHIASD